MRKTRWAILLACVAVALTVMVVPAAGATPAHTAASGVWSWGGDYGGSDFVVAKVVGGNQFFTGYEYGGWTGTFTGTSYEPFNGVIFKSGTMWAIITINFTGTVLGENGTAVMKLTVNAPPPPAIMGGRWAIVSGSGGLRHLHGFGTWIWVADMATYSYGNYDGTVWMR